MKKLKSDPRKIEPGKFDPPRRKKPKLCPTCKWMHSCPDAKIYQREYCSDYEQDL